MYSSKTIANYFIDNCEQISLIKLIKLIYFSHGWYLAIFNKPLIDECIQAGKYGVEIETIKKEFIREFGGKEFITRKAIEYNYTPTINFEDKETIDFLNKIIEVYNKLTAIQLSNLSHFNGSPWKKIYNEYNGLIPKNMIIQDSDMKEYFLKKVNDKNNKYTKYNRFEIMDI